MNRNDLKELAANPDFISGIYNYCDRWCERCAFSSRCFLYATEKADPELDDPDVRSLNNAKFWRKLESIFKDAHELIKECAEEAGIDLDAIDENEAAVARDAQPQDRRRHELSMLARNYAGMVQTWFANEFPTEHNLRRAVRDANSTEAEIDIPAAVEIIRWYQFFIAAKVFRAVIGSDEELDGVYAVDPATGDNPAQTDSNGSAKIALIAIDRSGSAWRILDACVPGKRDSIAPLMLALENLRSGLEEILPQARDFVRPGFDEVISEFSS
jgi:hypothetical protein